MGRCQAGFCSPRTMEILEREVPMSMFEITKNGGKSTYYNLGNGNGFSVKEVIDMTEKVTGITIPRKIEGRRPGDPATLVASSEKIKRELGWKPRYDSLESIISSAWKWHSTHPHGYQK